MHVILCEGIVLLLSLFFEYYECKTLTYIWEGSDKSLEIWVFVYIQGCCGFSRSWMIKKGKALGIAELYCVVPCALSLV